MTHLAGNVLRNAPDGGIPQGTAKGAVFEQASGQNLGDKFPKIDHFDNGSAVNNFATEQVGSNAQFLSAVRPRAGSIQSFAYRRGRGRSE